MKIRSFMGWCSVPFLVLACSAGANEGHDTGAETASATAAQASSTSAEDASSPAAMLRAFEDVAVAVEQEQPSGELASAWATTKSARQDSEVAALIGQIRDKASSEDLLAFGSKTIERYVSSFDPTVEAIQLHATDGTVDAKLVGRVQTLTAVIDRVAQTDSSSGDRAADYCCVVHNTPTDCFNWHTAGVWAASKCVAKGIGLNRSGSSLFKQTCDYGAPTYCNIIH